LKAASRDCGTPFPFMVAIITASYGGMDAPKEIPAQTIPCNYICVTDREVRKDSYNPAGSRWSVLDARMKAKYFKLQAHKLFDYDVLIWVDGNVEIKDSCFAEGMVAALGPAAAGDIALRRHPERGCIYEEAEFIVHGIRSGDQYLIARYAGLPIQEEADSYRKENHPENWGLWWCGLFARRVNTRINSFFDAWWDACLRWSAFDQNSFPYLARRFDIKIKSMNWGSYYNNDTYKIVPHLKMQ
jgi:Protein of unknown function (DUF616)